MFYTKNMCTCMHTIQDVRSCEYTQPPWAFTRTWATTRVKRVDMLYLGTYTEGGRYFGRALLPAFTVWPAVELQPVYLNILVHVTHQY